MRKTISIELPSHVIEWLEFLKASDDDASRANALPPDSTVEKEAAFQIEVAYMQACAAGRVPAVIMDDKIPF
jgi:hypothetical protein